MRTLVITPCSAKKRGNVAEGARAEDLADPGQREQAEARFAALAHPASEMYSGTHHRLVMEGVQAVWTRWGRQVLDLAILSAGYGLLRADEVIVPYDVTFDEFDERVLDDWAAHLQIPERTAALVRDYDLVFYLLSGRPLSVLSLPLLGSHSGDVPPVVQHIVLTAQDSLSLVPAAPNHHPFVADGPVAARRWHVRAAHVRGFLFRRLCGQVVQHGPAVLEWLYYQPRDTERLFYKRARWRPQWRLW